MSGAGRIAYTWTRKRDKESAVSTARAAEKPYEPTAHGESVVPTVESVMTRGVLSAYQHAPVKEVIASMVTQRVSTVPVLDPERRVVGVVTSADLLTRMSGDRGTVPRGHRLTALRERDRKAAGRQAGDVMTAPAITARPGESITSAARTMARARVRCLPVIDEDGILAGIVTKGDLLKNFVRNDNDVRRAIEQDVIGKSLLLAPFSVMVSVVEGIVTLCGFVDSPALEDQLVTKVRALPGVIDVDSTQLRTRVETVRIGTWV